MYNQLSLVYTLRESFDPAPATVRNCTVVAVDVRNKLIDEDIAPHALLCCIAVSRVCHVAMALASVSTVQPTIHHKERYGDCIEDARSVMWVVVVRQWTAVDKNVDCWRDCPRFHRIRDEQCDANARQLVSWPAAVQVIHNWVATVSVIQARRTPIWCAGIVAWREVNAIPNWLVHRRA